MTQEVIIELVLLVGEISEDFTTSPVADPVFS